MLHVRCVELADVLIKWLDDVKLVSEMGYFLEMTVAVLLVLLSVAMVIGFIIICEFVYLSFMYVHVYILDAVSYMCARIYCVCIYTHKPILFCLVVKYDHMSTCMVPISIPRSNRHPVKYCTTSFNLQ